MLKTKHYIDLFARPENPTKDFRWDVDKNAKLLNIVYRPATFGNFLKFFLDKFSKLSPDLQGDPFNKTGIVDGFKAQAFSGLIQKYHATFINDNEGETNLPICIIVPTKRKHYLYLKKAQWFRAGDSHHRPDDLWQTAKGEMPEKLIESSERIRELYSIKEDAYFSWIPKFIVRDWYKLEFTEDPHFRTYDNQWYTNFKKHQFFAEQNVFELDLESFFDWEIFLKNIAEMDKVFGLQLDFNRQESMKELFDRGLGMDKIRQECNMVEDVLENETDVSLRDLDVATEGYIYAELEKQNPGIQMPLTNRFFRDFEEIKQFLEHFPIFYRKS